LSKAISKGIVDKTLYNMLLNCTVYKLYNYSKAADKYKLLSLYTTNNTVYKIK
jgi:hypothetical protein